jgi:hypothetical protein
MDDTHPRVRDLQIALLRGFSPARRFAMAIELTRATIAWSRRAVRETMPGAAEADVLLRWIELTYGRELAERLRPIKARLGADPWMTSQH